MGYRHKEVITASLMLKGISQESQAADSLREQSPLQKAIGGKMGDSSIKGRREE